MDLVPKKMEGKDRAEWLADKICNGGDFGKEAAFVLVEQAEEIERLRNDNKALKYSLQLDEDLIGMIKKIIEILNSRPDPTPNE